MVLLPIGGFRDSEKETRKTSCDSTHQRRKTASDVDVVDDDEDDDANDDDDENEDEDDDGEGAGVSRGNPSFWRESEQLKNAKESEEEIWME